MSGVASLRLDGTEGNPGQRHRSYACKSGQTDTEIEKQRQPETETTRVGGCVWRVHTVRSSQGHGGVRKGPLSMVAFHISTRRRTPTASWRLGSGKQS